MRTISALILLCLAAAACDHVDYVGQDASAEIDLDLCLDLCMDLESCGEDLDDCMGRCRYWLVSGDDAMLDCVLDCHDDLAGAPTEESCQYLLGCTGECN